MTSLSDTFNNVHIGKLLWDKNNKTLRNVPLLENNQLQVCNCRTTPSLH